MTAEKLTLHNRFSAAGRPVARGDILLWSATGAWFRVTSSDGLCLVLPAERNIASPQLSLRLVTRRLLGLPADAQLTDEEIITHWRTLTATDANAAIAWLRQRQPQAVHAPLPPAALAASLLLGERRCVACLLPHTLVRLREADHALAPWLLEAGHAAWEALVGEMRDRIYEDPEFPLTPGRSCRLIERWGSHRLMQVATPWPASAPRLRLADAIRLNAVYQRAREVPTASRPIWPIMACRMLEALTAAHRVAIRTELGVHGPGDLTMPILDYFSITSDQRIIRCHATGLPYAEAVRLPDGWQLRMANDGLKYKRYLCEPHEIAEMISAEWLRTWRWSSSWLPEPNIPSASLHGIQWAALIDDFDDAFQSAGSRLQSDILKCWSEPK